MPEAAVGLPILDRCWIVQELLAAKHIVIHTNGEVWSWSDLSTQLARVSTHYIPGPIDRIIGARYRKELVRGDAGLLNLLTIFQQSKCSDIRDKVFSLFKISKEHRDGRRLLVSYRKAVPQLFFETLVYLNPTPSVMLPVAQRLARILELDFEEVWQLVNVPGGYLLSAIPSNVTFVTKLAKTAQMFCHNLPLVASMVLKPFSDPSLQILRDEALSMLSIRQPFDIYYSIFPISGDLVIIATHSRQQESSEMDVILVCRRDELDSLKPHSDFDGSPPQDPPFVDVRLTKRQLLLAMSPDGQLPRTSLESPSTRMRHVPDGPSNGSTLLFRGTINSLHSWGAAVVGEREHETSSLTLSACIIPRLR